MGDFGSNDLSIGGTWEGVFDSEKYALEHPFFDPLDVKTFGVDSDIGTYNTILGEEGLLGAPYPHQGPLPSGNPVQPLPFDYPPLAPPLAPPPYGANAVQPTAPPPTTTYPTLPGYALASHPIPGGYAAQPTPSTCTPSPHPEANTPTPQETQADTPPEPQPKKRGRGRPVGSKDKGKRDPKGTHAGKSKGELSRLARERAKRRRLEAERAKEGEEKEEREGPCQEQEQEQGPGEQSWTGQQVPVQDSGLGYAQWLFMEQMRASRHRNLGREDFGWVDTMAGPSHQPQQPQPQQQQHQQFPSPPNDGSQFADPVNWYGQP
ncbi:hypothetical protein G6514_000711 [Epicoccum nigrum]|nr:hypothetical protein G6514_000711 [Epicoccum nigrum]